ncbi:TetR/AcrR family transcriptional regulator [Streptacidiphilus anmyonensis]|uniref:TetR/AcrR family transcriptional regulator n=1 Tax=Streptacidiphilus anmyonensis TaxID=405782 RepID=UPI0005AA9199|nr:TetR/AcrR family transcriptional regulator [Streptacidiphilus anmyonensis]
MADLPTRAVRRPRATATAVRRDTLILDALERLLASTPLSELDVEQIAAEAGITRTRFYAYYSSKHDALAALLRRLIAVRTEVYEQPGSWFIDRAPDVRPREALRETIEAVTRRWWAHRFVLREACDLWTVAPQVREVWLDAIDIATTRIETAIQRERDRGIAPPGLDARTTAQALAWQAERLNFRAWAQLPQSLSQSELCEVCLTAFMRMIYLADDPDPEHVTK